MDHAPKVETLNSGGRSRSVTRKSNYDSIRAWHFNGVLVSARLVGGQATIDSSLMRCWPFDYAGQLVLWERETHMPAGTFAS